MSHQKHRELLASYLAKGRVMQLATVRGSQPWICTVYYVIDDRLNFYWLSLPSRRHSQELADQSNAAITVAIKHDLPVIGVQAEGTVEEVADREAVKTIAELYVKKYGSAKTYYERFVQGVHQHHLYKLTPTRIVLFDEVEFPPNTRIEIVP